MFRGHVLVSPANVAGLRKSYIHASRIIFGLSGTEKQTYIDGGQAKNLDAVRASAKKYNDYVSKTTENWDKMNDIYYGKDRDMTNFPPMKMSENHPKVRMGFLPDSWFTAFYEKTGVTGPYLFMWGGILFLVQKEFWVVDHEFMEIAPIAVAIAYVIKKFGGRVSAALQKKTDRINYLRNERPIEILRNQSEAVVKHAEAEIDRSGGVKHVFEAKRENVDHQLEAVYRQRLQDIHNTVKRRLDYHVERENSRRRFQQDHMVNWIVDSVVKGITPQQEKDALAQSIQNLKALAKNA